MAQSAELAATLSATIDPQPWAKLYQGDRWAPLQINETVALPQQTVCKSAGSSSDCEGRDALEFLFYHHAGGVALELGGIDGKAASETRVLELHANFKRVIIEADPNARNKRRRASPTVLGVTAAVCSSAGWKHYLHHRMTSGLVEFMPDTFLRRWYPKLARMRPHLQPINDWSKVNFTDVGVRHPITRVACVPLTDILEHIGIRHIHFAILDTEGSELEILSAVDFRRVSFGCLVIEVFSSNFGSRPVTYAAEVDAFLTNASGGQYRQIFPPGKDPRLGGLRGRNLWFLHRDFVAHARAPRGGVFSWALPRPNQFR